MPHPTPPAIHERDGEYMNTYSNTTSVEIDMTFESLKKAADMVQKMDSKELPKGLSWFTRLMARFGWHRKYEVIFFDKSKFGMFK